MSDERVDVRLRFYDLNLDFAALRETLDRMREALSRVGKSADILRFLEARSKGQRYWTDCAGRIRLMPGMKPILSHGKRSRRLKQGNIATRLVLS